MWVATFDHQNSIVGFLTVHHDAIDMLHCERTIQFISIQVDLIVPNVLTMWCEVHNLLHTGSLPF